MIIKNKKAGEKLLSIWWVFVLVVIGIGVVSGVAIYHSKDISVNGVEADVVAGKVIDCIIDNGYLNPNLLNENFDIFQECSLEKGMFVNQSYFYLSVFVFDNEALVKKIAFGSMSIEKECEISNAITAEYFAKCSRKDGFGILNDKNLKIIVIGGSRQTGKKVLAVS